MKQRWKQWAMKYEAMSMRERLMVGGAVLAGIVYIINTLMIEPALAREKTMKNMIQQQRMAISTMSLDVVQRQVAAQADPDKDAKQRLAQLTQDNQRMRDALRTMQKGLVAPERMSVLLQQLLGNSRLKLVSLKTLPARGMSDGKFAEPEPVAGPAPAPAPAPGIPNLMPPAQPPGAGGAGGAQPARPVVKQDELLYRHGVQIVVEGSYLDMVAYMQALEAMPEQLFWGKATLNAQQYPKATLSLTLYTLSLDQKWIAL
jgi:MSHA biogenesis protein MshJ